MVPIYGESLRETLGDLLIMPNEQLAQGVQGMQQALGQGTWPGEGGAAAAVQLILTFAQDVIEERRQAGITA